MTRKIALLAALVCTVLLVLPAPGLAADEADDSKLTSGTFSGLAWRSLGPALTSGRISEIAVVPSSTKTWYVAVSSGGVWKTVNAGTTFEPIFDGEGSYSIGTVTVDPSDPNIVWVGTGENNSQRSVSYGDGVYKSLDGGRSWTHMGLDDSQHIGMITVDPRDSNTVFVASQGPLWNDGGDRGLYKTTDGGESWIKVLDISEKTGVNEVHMDPRDPDLMYASTYQRRRRVWTLLDGGPEGGIHKSTDGGETWRQVSSGLPSGDVGRIGLDISPANPDVVYAIVEAERDKGGFFRSSDRGEHWQKMGSYVSGSPQYYNELIADPHDVDRVYSMDTWMQVTEDGGRSWSNVGEDTKHVDNHSLWIDPTDPDHLIAGCDGGIYETWDRAATWHFKPNLPITQFYRVGIDDAEPFYNVYGGTQDNFTLGGPVRTTNRQGITNRDWFVTVGGDGFESQVEPGNPNIVYSQWQYGGLVRHDRATGEMLDIKPQPELGEVLKWNWDAPLLISPHDPARLYFGANRLFRSDDRGDSWRPISGDLTRGIDRNELEVMGEVWSVDAVAKNRSTSFFGNLVALTESPFVDGLIYTGTDDGLVHVTEDGGETWRKIESFPGVPAMTYVADLEASRTQADTVYATFDAHKDGDFRPYVLVSRDRGATWSSISGDLPERGTVYTIVPDHERDDLLFVGTEFGAFFTLDGGSRWVQLSAGMPTVAIFDLEIQRRENDLVAASFGRGFYVLDDYSPLRDVTEAGLEGETTLFPVKRAWMYIPSLPLGLPGKSFQGDSFYTADNPPFGAIFTYYLPEGLESLADERRGREGEAREAGEPVGYPPWEELRAEDREESPSVIVTVRDEDGNVVRRLEGPTGAGFHRVAWDLRYPAYEPVDLSSPSFYNPFSSPDMGPMAAPGTYTVSIATRMRDVTTSVAEAQTFEAQPLGHATLPLPDLEEALAFNQKAGRLLRAVYGATNVVDEMEDRIAHLEVGLRDTPAAEDGWRDELRSIELGLADLSVSLTGDRTVARRAEPTTPSIASRIGQVVGGSWETTSGPTATHRRNYEIAASQFAELLPELQALEAELVAFESKTEAAGTPWTPGRVPTWELE